MPTRAEYDEIFNANTLEIFDTPYKNMAEARHIVALANSATIKKRIEMTGNITKAWVSGYAVLKAENDQMQKDLAGSFKSEMQMNREWLGTASEGLQR